MRNNSGPKTNPWGTPLVTVLGEEKEPETVTENSLPLRKTPINFKTELPLHSVKTSKAVSSTVLDQMLWRNSGEPRPPEQSHHHAIHLDSQ